MSSHIASHTHTTIYQKRIRLRIPKNYHEQPVISRLVSDFGLVINIRAAILGADAVGDGWFDLDLQGTSTQIENAIAYIRDLELEIWEDDQGESW